MSLTTNQGLELPDGTDNANVPLAMTQYNAGVENRLVQRYLSIADRTARNPVPTEGELSYLGDSDIYEVFRTGMGWLPLIHEYNYDINPASFGTSSLTYTTAGAALIGFVIRANSTGKIRVGFTANMSNASTQQTYLAAQLNTGSVLGAGAVVVAADDNLAALVTGTPTMSGTSFVTFAGLTPGAFYNAFLNHRVTGSTSTIARRAIEVSQV